MIVRQSDVTGLGTGVGGCSPHACASLSSQSPTFHTYYSNLVTLLYFTRIPLSFEAFPRQHASTMLAMRTSTRGLSRRTWQAGNPLALKSRSVVGVSTQPCGEGVVRTAVCRALLPLAAAAPAPRQPQRYASVVPRAAASGAAEAAKDDRLPVTVRVSGVARNAHAPEQSRSGTWKL